MRRAKSKFRPSVGGVQGRVESVPRSPQTNSSPVTPTTPNVPSIAQVDPNEPTIELKAIPDPVEPLAIQGKLDNQSSFRCYTKTNNSMRFLIRFFSIIG